MKKISIKFFKKDDIERLQKGYNLFHRYALADVGPSYKEELKVVLRKTPVELIDIDDFLELVCRPCDGPAGVSDCKNCQKRLKLIATYLLTPFKDKIQSYKNFCSLYLMIEVIHNITFSPLKKYYIDELKKSSLTVKEKQDALNGIKYLPDYDLYYYYQKKIGNKPTLLPAPVEELYARYVERDEMKAYVGYRMEREHDCCCFNKEDLWHFFIDVLDEDYSPEQVLEFNNDDGKLCEKMQNDELNNYLDSNSDDWS